MKRLAAALFATAFIAAAPQALAQVAGHTALGVSVTELDAIIEGVRASGKACQVLTDVGNFAPKSRAKSVGIG